MRPRCRALAARFSIYLSIYLSIDLRGEVMVAARRPRVAAEHDGLLHAELARSLAAVVVVVAL